MLDMVQPPPSIRCGLQWLHLPSAAINGEQYSCRLHVYCASIIIKSQITRCFLPQHPHRDKTSGAKAYRRRRVYAPITQRDFVFT